MRDREISNSLIYELSNIEAWSNEIKRRSLQWFGHLVLLSENAPAKTDLG